MSLLHLYDILKIKEWYSVDENVIICLDWLVYVQKIICLRVSSCFGVQDFPENNPIFSLFMTVMIKTNFSDFSPTSQ